MYYYGNNNNEEERNAFPSDDVEKETFSFPLRGRPSGKGKTKASKVQDYRWSRKLKAQTRGLIARRFAPLFCVE
jgi:hypothetical protein